MVLSTLYLTDTSSVRVLSLSLITYNHNAHLEKKEPYLVPLNAFFEPIWAQSNDFIVGLHLYGTTC